ncbi:MAG: right-handed parallel beta-helix repeat-containing protein [Opitutaceae bacterium]
MKKHSSAVRSPWWQTGLGLVAVALFVASCRSVGATPDVAPPAHAAAPPARAVATFQSVGLYWSPGQEPGDCSVSYQKIGDTGWRDGMPLWFDARDGEYRGSLVGLEPDARYRVRMVLNKGAASTELEVATWPENPPIARVVTLPAGILTTPYVIDEGGSPAGYVLYQASDAGGTTINVGGESDHCVRVKSSYVIIRGLRLEDSARHGLVIEGDRHDIVIEHCDISGWGRIAPDGFGENFDSGIYANTPGTARLVIRDNRIHHPRSNSNDWSQSRANTGEKLSAHPNGPQGIFIRGSHGNNVICHNEIFSDESHRFNDGMGEWNNYSNAGFPGADSDICNNVVTNVADDAMEIEGSGRNVRVWGNLIDHSYQGIAAAVCNAGPLYIFRNVMGVSRKTVDVEAGGDNRGSFAKLGDGKGFGGGRIYFFHNTALQPVSPAGISLGARCGVADWGGPMVQVVTRNNIWWMAPPTGGHSSYAISSRTATDTNDFDHDLYTGIVRGTTPAEPDGIQAEPNLLPGSVRTSMTPVSWPYLSPASPGYGRAVALPNFNDMPAGGSADIGTAQTGVPAPWIGIRQVPSGAMQRDIK